MTPLVALAVYLCIYIMSSIGIYLLLDYNVELAPALSSVAEAEQCLTSMG